MGIIVVTFIIVVIVVANPTQQKKIKMPLCTKAMKEPEGRQLTN